jgi:hypothetical protein
MTSSRFHRRITMLAHRSARPKRLPWRPGAILVALLVGLLVTSPALSALRLGTKNAETLTGTSGNDHITGAEGNDTLIGKAGNDTYFFADNWGADTLIEKPGEGIDTLNFRGVKNGVGVYNIREWHDKIPAYPYASASGADEISFTSAAGVAVIEKVIGGQGDDDGITGGGGPNTFMPGGGVNDLLQDYGGYNDGAAGMPEIPTSNDTYKGFADNTGTVTILDWGGTGDVVDMRPFSTDDVYISRRDLDSNGTEESLQIVTGPTSQVIVGGHFGPYSTYASALGQQGRIEKLIFADATFNSTNGLAAATATSATATSGKQATLAEAADRLAEEARIQLAAMPEPSTPSGPGEAEGEPKLSGEPAKPHNKADTKHAPATTDPHEKKQATKTKARHEKHHPSQATGEKKHAAKDTNKKKGATEATKPRAKRP